MAQGEEIEKFLEDLGIGLSSADLARRLRRREKGKSCFDLFLEQCEEPFEKPPFFEATLVRHIRLTRRIALELIDESGDLNEASLEEWISFLEKKSDWRLNWTLYALKIVPKKALMQIHSPVKGLMRPTFAADIIADTLNVKKEVSDADARRAVLAAFITDLRQEVGSCFATAPARLIRAALPERFFADMFHIITRGYLTRVIEGVQVEIPVCTHWGRGGIDRPIHLDAERKKLAYILTEVSGLSFLCVWHAVKKMKEGATARRCLEALGSKNIQRLRGMTLCPLLKAWEYTLASMSDIKLDFFHWNSFHALGLDPKAQGGLGAFLIGRTEERGEKLQEQIEELNQYIHTSEQHLNSIGIRAKNATNEADFMHLKSASAGESARLSRLTAERGALVDELQNLGAVIEPLLRAIGEAFKLDFAELFDPDLGGDETKAFVPDDRAAGFRLAYKHGRIDPASWTVIEDSLGWMQALSLFFNHLTTSLAYVEPFDQLAPHTLHQLMGWIQHWLSEPDLVELAKRRCDQNRPGANPWSSISGGTVHHLLGVYFECPPIFAEEKKKPASADELLAFLIESAYALPLASQEQLKKDPFAGLILLAPRHCATFHPQWEAFYAGWRREQYPYTWVRDHVIAPAKARLEEFHFDTFTAAAFVDRLRPFAPPFQVDLSGNMTVMEMAKCLIPHLPPDLIDFALYSWLPMVRGNQLDGLIAALCCSLGMEKPLDFSKVSQYSCFTKRELFDCMRLCRAPVDEHLEEAARRVGASLATSLPFADSNWTREYLSFVLSPSSGNLEVWRTDPTGASGAPMRQWKFPVATWSVLLETFLP